VRSGEPSGEPEGCQVSATAEVADTAHIGGGSRIWQLAQVREGASLGRSCIVGRGAYVGPGVSIGDNVKIQNHALVYEPAEVERGAFIGPAVVLTNDLHPRSVDTAGRLKTGADWTSVGVTVREGASLGARSVCVAPVVIGRWAMVGAGAVVVSDVPDFALVVGVPARQIGWVGRAGARLQQGDDGLWQCPQTGESYQEVDGKLHDFGT
jgi:UDP-2-acetamido-3-amino-2,3-dideoxy-glucuronate N-acetyltransferase